MNDRLPYGPLPGKYPPPPESVEGKPNTEGLMSHLPPHSSGVPMLIGPTGLPAHPLSLSHLPPNHPSLVSSPQTATVPPNTASSIQGTLHTVQEGSFIVNSTALNYFTQTVQPLNLLGSTASLIAPPSTSTVVHPGLHRPPETSGLHHQWVSNHSLRPISNHCWMC